MTSSAVPLGRKTRFQPSLRLMITLPSLSFTSISDIAFRKDAESFNAGFI
jgi:hypothetical protein